MPERPPERPPEPPEDEHEREREESTDLGYRDTEEQRAYEDAAAEDADSD